MGNRSKVRVLSFERLEVKATPTSLLLALAPQNDNFHAAAERMWEPSSTEFRLQLDTSANWQVAVSTQELLRFVEDHSCCQDRDYLATSSPSVEQCRGVDEMMRLDDLGTRAMIIAEQIAPQ